MSPVTRAGTPVRYVRKTADETVNNSAELQDDDHLKLSLNPGEELFVEGFLSMEAASTTADWKLGWSGPSGASAKWGVAAARGEAIAGGVWTAATPAQAQTKAISLSESVSIGGANLSTALMLAGWFICGETGGTLKFQWAQNTQTAENNKILKNSFLRATKLG